MADIPDGHPAAVRSGGYDAPSAATRGIGPRANPRGMRVDRTRRLVTSAASGEELSLDGAQRIACADATYRIVGLDPV